MSETRTFVIRQMHLGDLEECMLLSGAEHWNQTETDWKRFISGPQNHCLVAESENRIVGTATAMNYADLISWIGMVLVDKDYRGMGIARKLVSSLLDMLNSCKSVKLDSTPAGQPVYEKLGFKNEYFIHRMIKSSEQILQEYKSTIIPEPVKASDIPEISLMDFSVLGADRNYLFNSIYKENPGRAWCIKHHERITAFSLGRKGKNYFQIGPVVAQGTEEAKTLILSAILELSGEPLVVDVPVDKPELIQLLKDNGFSYQRQFSRMYLHENPIPGNLSNYYLICGPEYG